MNSSRLDGEMKWTSRLEGVYTRRAFASFLGEACWDGHAQASMVSWSFQNLSDTNLRLGSGEMNH